MNNIEILLDEENAEFEENYGNENKYVIIKIADNRYGIPIDLVNEISLLPRSTPLPDSPRHVRGVINLRGEIIPVIDSRIRFGLQTHDEMDKILINLLSQRKQDHLNWLAELYACIDEDRQFKLTTDPHGCAFGK